MPTLNKEQMDNVTTFSFCDSYIDELIEFIDREYIKKGKDIGRLAIVFGGKRPSLFVKRALAKRLKKTFFPPKFFTIDEFIQYTVKKHESFGFGLDLDGCYLLYHLARQKTPALLKGRESFAEFLPWSREIIRFIEQLDLESIPNESLEQIEANAAIGYAVPKDINRLLEHIVILREEFHKKLLENKTYSRGLTYFRASQVIKKSAFDEFDQIIFCNFFYFHRTEEEVVKHLSERGKATLIFQGDERKWPILERIARRLSCSIREGETVDKPDFNLKLYSGFDAHAQVGAVREILKTIKNPEETVIVLPNSNHIMPLLTEVAQAAKDFNISMGYPLRRSSLYSLFKFIAQSQSSRKSHRYYSKDYLKVIRHPFIKNLEFEVDSTVTRTLIHKIEEILTGKVKSRLTGSLFIELEDLESGDELFMLTIEALTRLGFKSTRDELLTILERIHEQFFYNFEPVRNFKEFASVLHGCLQTLLHQSPLKKYPFNLNIVERMMTIKEELELAAFNKEQFSLDEMFKIVEHKISTEMVNFLGSPLKGLQILGLLETRSLNFENVIVLDTNEGVLPSLRVYEPLIPREVMISLNLDRLELEEEIQRYQFMRLISSAKNVHLVYQKSKDKERSRFIEELLWDKEQEAGQLNAIPIKQTSFQVKVLPQEKRVKKTKAMVEMLKKHVYSASSINTYVRNPMEFYMKYVLGLEEKEDLLDEPEAKNVGTFVHELLEHSFHPFLNKAPKIDLAFRKRFFDQFEDRFKETFGRNLGSDAFLLKAVLKERLERFLDKEEEDEDRQVEKILYLENRFEQTIALKSGDIRFRYIVDRVDQLKDGTIMIIDYKTGAIDQMPKAIDKIKGLTLSREAIRDNIKSFQIPLYFHYLNEHFNDKPINACLYNLRTLEMHSFLKEAHSQESRKEIDEVFLKGLDFVIGEILDIDQDFVEDRTLI